MKQRKNEQGKPLAKIDGYELFIRNGAYYVRFHDSNQVLQETKVTKGQFAAFLKSAAQAKKERNEMDRHIEQSLQTDVSLHNRMLDPDESLEDRIIRKAEIERLRESYRFLTEIQWRRLYQYFYEEQSYEQIAKAENVHHSSVEDSIRIALETLGKILRDSRTPPKM